MIIRFWEIAAPVMVFVIVAFMFPDIQRLIYFIKKRMATRKYDVSSNCEHING